MTRRPLRVGVAATLLAVLAGTTATLAGVAVPASGVGATVSASAPAAAGDTNGYRETKTLIRGSVDQDGAPAVTASYDVTVSADKTRDLRGRQRIKISWTGAQPSGGRAANPYGENGLNQEYPVVIMQCRGLDDPKLPAAKQLSPETCWTASVAQRSQILRSEAEAAWRLDAFAPAADRERVSGLDPLPSAEECPAIDIDPFATRLTPFRGAKGTVYPGCDADSMPPEAAVGAAFPPAEIAAFTDGDGTGDVQFEVRSDVENESLGCSHKVACSIVVIPIVGISCDRPETPMTGADRACRKTGRFPAGSSNFTNDGVDQAVSPALWWSESNWRNRFSIPITFGLPPDTCDVLDPRPPTGFYGSELLAQAALQWSPAYCLDKKRFKFQLNQMSDEAGWNLMEAGQGAAAVVSSEHDKRGEDPVAYAPIAVTGFSVGYVIDRPDNAGEYARLRLNARLIAKLLTQSYLGSDLGREHKGIGDNPLAIMEDPEFQKLNPGLSDNVQEAGATLLNLSNSSDVVEQLTEYIAQDKDAQAFVDGKKDPWGMVVNPAYKKIELPRPEWPLLDTYIPETQNTCRQENPAVYFTQLAAPVTTMRKIAEALLDAWPNVQTRCEFDQSTKQYKLGRIDRQSFGSRFMVGITSLGDAARYGLRSASLETAKGNYVAPTDASLAAAVGLATQEKKFEPFRIDQADVAKSRQAYPGTMVLYAAARTSNLDQAEAEKVATFIRVSTTEGQRSGSGNGELPEGFLPIKGGETRKLLEAANEAADAIEAQVPPKSDPDPSDNGPGGPGSDPGGPPSTDPPPSGDKPDPKPTTDETDVPELDAAPTSGTTSIDSGIAGLLLPGLLALGLLGGLYSGASRFFVRPPRPPL
jgi:hypothetical protein